MRTEYYWKNCADAIALLIGVVLFGTSIVIAAHCLPKAMPILIQLFR
jgi:hypothetical protein